MRLVNYKLDNPPQVGTMDKYFHIMFKNALPFIDGNGNITTPNMGDKRIKHIVPALEKLTKDHPVGWYINVNYSGYLYEFIAKGGKVEYNRVRSIAHDYS